VGGPRLAFGPYRLDVRDESLWHGDRRLAMPPKSFAVLHYLVEHAGRLVTKDELLEAIWPDTYVADGVLKVRVREIRALLQDEAEAPRFIETVHRRGYRFIAEVRADAVGDGGALAAGADGAPGAKRPRAGELATPAASAAIEAIAAAEAPIGRERELSQLAEALRAASAGRRRIVFVSGEAGIGKSSLVDAFLAAIPSGCALVARGQCLEHHGGGEAYLPILEALAQLARGPDAEPVTDALRRVAPTWLTQLPWLLSASDRETLQRELQGTTRERMLRELAEALEALTRDRALVLALEDLHWSDPSTVDVLSLLAHRRAPARLLVVGTYRPVDVIVTGHPLKVVKHRLEMQRLAAELCLPFLERGHVALYLERRLGVRDLPAGLAEAVLERTAGNPLFVVSLVDQMLERGWLTAVGGAASWRVSRAKLGDEVPEGLRQMIEQQLERLSADDARVLEAASVAGGEFAAAAVAAALDAPPAQVEVVCEGEARRGQFLRSLGSAALPDGEVSGRFAFAHALHREVLHARLGPSRRAALHRAIGEWQERIGASPAETARHFLDAGAAGVERAIAHSLKAAERAERVHAHAEAAAHYRLALEALAHAPEAPLRERCRVLVALGEAEERSGALGDARATFARAAELARAAEAHDLFARAALGMGRGHHVVSRVDEELVALLEEALDGVPPADVALRALLLARLDAALSPIAGAHERREPLARDAIAIARGLDDPDVLLGVLRYTRWGFSGREAVDELRSEAAHLGELARRATTKEQALDLQLLRIADLHEAGDVAEAGEALADFEALADEAGIPWFCWFALRLAALRAAQDGRLAEADRLIGRAAAFGRRMDHPNVLPVFGVQRLQLRVLEGRLAEAATMASAWIERSPDQHSTRATLALVRLRSGDVAGARADLDVLAAEGFRQIARDSVWLICIATAAEVCAGLADERAAATLEALFRPYAERVIGVGPNLASLGHGTRPLGLLARTLGRWDEAAALLERARAEHDRMGALPWLAITRLDQARTLAARSRTGRRRAVPAAARDAARDAENLARELGMGAIAREAAAFASESA